MNFVYCTVDGDTYDFSKSSIAPIKLQTLLNSIAREYRFNNQTDWTVLQHSIAMGLAADVIFDSNVPMIQYAYFHDIHEGVFSDVPRPIKDAIGGKMEAVEKEIQEKILRSYNLDFPSTGDLKLVTALDKTMSFVESVMFHSDEKVQMMLQQADYDPTWVVACTSAINFVSHMEIMDENLMVTPEVVKIMKEVLTLGF